ncbi:hypothetical protein BKA62DRAFT_710171 [Auriculariales sp. MPI-PUGE-AT-0066]|nr:hypothetical protein BKA62DRAFT_710171 [Auriculariales sp. MPI-PUGE-AT-0066]
MAAYAQSVARAHQLDPRTWPLLSAKLFQYLDPLSSGSSGRDPQWQDPDELFDAFELVNGMAQTLRQLKALAAMGDRHWVGKIVQRIKGIGAFSAGWLPPPASPMPTPPEQTFGVQSHESYATHSHSPNPYHTQSTLSPNLYNTPSSRSTFDHSRSNTSRPYDRRSIHHPCVIHMQCVTHQALQTLYLDPWVQRNFSITPGLGPTDLQPWPTGAPWGNVTLVSRALKVPGTPFSVPYVNSAPTVRAHALFVPIRLCMRSSGRFRTILLCNSELEPYFDPHNGGGEQYEQMRCVAALLRPDDPYPVDARAAARPPDLGIGGRHAIGVFAGLVHAAVNDAAPMGGGGGALKGEFVAQMGTAGATEHGKPAFLVARIGFHQVLLE